MGSGTRELNVTRSFPFGGFVNVSASHSATLMITSKHICFLHTNACNNGNILGVRL